MTRSPDINNIKIHESAYVDDPVSIGEGVIFSPNKGLRAEGDSHEVKHRGVFIAGGKGDPSTPNTYAKASVFFAQDDRALLIKRAAYKYFR